MIDKKKIIGISVITVVISTIIVGAIKEKNYLQNRVREEINNSKQLEKEVKELQATIQKLEGENSYLESKNTKAQKEIESINESRKKECSLLEEKNLTIYWNTYCGRLAASRRQARYKAEQKSFNKAVDSLRVLFP